MRWMRIVRALGCGAVLSLLSTADARASDWWTNVYVSPGVVVSWATSPDTSAGAGFEISAGYTSLTSNLLTMLHFGGVYRAQDNDAGSSGHYGRHTIALEGGVGLFGVELGYAFRDEFLKARATSGLHLMPYVSIGILYLGPQFLVPITTSGNVEFAFNLGIKVPLPQSIIFPLALVAMSGFRGD